MKKFTIQSAVSKAIAIMIAVIIICGVVCAVSYDANPGIFTGFAVASNVLIVATGVCCGIFAFTVYAIGKEDEDENIPVENLCLRVDSVFVFCLGLVMMVLGTTLFTYSAFDIEFWPLIIASLVLGAFTILYAVAMIPLHIVKNHLVNKALDVEFE